MQLLLCRGTVSLSSDVRRSSRRIRCSALQTPLQKSRYVYGPDRELEDQAQFQQDESEKFLFGFVSSIPRPGKKNGGEDASFLCTSGGGVFDGVGGWQRQGIDPSMYSQSLARIAESACLMGMNSQIAMFKAWEATKAKGSSTACVATLKANGLLEISNLGDSGAMIFRGNKVELKTAAQQHSFNYPYQLGLSSNDTPKNAAYHQLIVEDGDIIILATDGLWDNLFQNEIKDQIQKAVATSPALGPEKLSKAISQNLARKAYERSISLTEGSPFKDEAVKAGRIPWWKSAAAQAKLGGKPDDITVLAAIVSCVGKFTS